MSTRLMTIAALAVAVTLASVAAASPVTTEQRVTIAAKGDIHRFVLRPLKPGAVAHDSGTADFCCWSERFTVRGGQKIEIDDPLMTLVGRHGRLEIRFRIEWVDAGNGYTVGTGTWKVVRGTGAYKAVRGGGRSAHAWLPNGPVSWRADGFLGPRPKAAATATRGAAVVTATADHEKASLRHYLAAMSWPLRASLGRGKAVMRAIDEFISVGDPPFLGWIANGCRKLQAVEARGRLLSITAPPRVQARHRSVVHRYSAARQGCIKAGATAHALVAASNRYYRTRSAADKAAMERADRAARTLLPRFERGALQPFVQAVRTWRSAALRYAASLGVPAPPWLKGLSVGSTVRENALNRYLSAMSWPVRASVGRAEAVTAAIDGFVTAGDPPLLGAIASGCREFRAVEPRGRLLRIDAPIRLHAKHRRLVSAYSKLRAECVEAGHIALFVRAALDQFVKTHSPEDKAAWQRADAAARESLPRFQQDTIQPFVRAVSRWRSAALAYSADLGLPSPEWLTKLLVRSPSAAVTP